MDFGAIDFSDPLVIGGAAVVAIIIVIIIWYAMTPSATTSTHYIWYPGSVGTTDPAAAVLAGTAAGSPVYVAAAPTSSGAYVIGKAASSSVWYPDNGKEQKIPLSSAILLPSSIGTLTWSPTLTRGVALSDAQDRFVCRVKLSNGYHPGFAVGGLAYFTAGGTVQSSSKFEYLNVA